MSIHRIGRPVPPPVGDSEFSSFFQQWFFYRLFVWHRIKNRKKNTKKNQPQHFFFSKYNFFIRS